MDKTKQQEEPLHKIFTIPNLMSAFRIVLIPLILWAYLVRESTLLTLLFLLISGLTDFLDGRVARRFHMVSVLGKALDPVADKLTQGCVLLCLVAVNPRIRLLFIVLVIKECIMAAMGIAFIQKTGTTYSAAWHGKVTTVLLYFTGLLHLVWRGIPTALSTVLVAACIVMMLYSLIRYIQMNIGQQSKKDQTVNSV